VRAPRIIVLVVGSIALAAVLFLFVLPSRTYLAQRQSLAAAETRLKVFRDENAQLAAQASQLQTSSDIQRIAREQYGLVMPGEKAYVIVPASGSTSAAASSSSAAKAATRPGLLSRVWRDVQFWRH